MTFCCVPSCPSQDAKIRFPKYRPSRSEWMKRFEGHVPPGWNPSHRSALCKLHFHKRDLRRKGKNTIRFHPVKRNAIPCYFPWTREKKYPYKKKILKCSKARESDECYTVHPQRCVTKESLKKALKVISGEIPAIHMIKQTKANLYCYNRKRSKKSSGLSSNVLLEELRASLLRHDWDKVILLLPKLYSMRYGQTFIWKIAMQVMCHHPNSSARIMNEFLQMCLRTNNISTKILRELFCIPQTFIQDSDDDSEESQAEDNDSEKSQAKDSEESQAEDNNSEKSQAKDNDSEESQAEDNDSEESQAEDNVSEESQAEDNDSEESQAEDNDSEESQAEDNDSEESQAEDNDSEESQAGDSD